MTAQVGETRSASQARLFELDAARFVAALAVVAFHYLFVGPARGRFEADFIGLSWIAQYGYLGVHFFFMLSGFVIVRSVDGKNARQFLRGRIVRLYPLYWVAVAAVTMLFVFNGGVGLVRVVANITMFQDLLGQKHLDASFWTLEEEAKFYVLIAFVMWTGQMSRLNLIFSGWLALTYLDTFVGFPYQAERLLLVGWNQYFIAGAVLHALHQRGHFLPVERVLFALSAFVGIYRLQRDGAIFRTAYDLDHSFVTSAFVVGGCFGFMWLVAHGRTAWLRSRRWAAVGMMTYPLYLIHQELGFELFNRLPWSLEVEAAVITSSMIIVSYLLARFVEPALAAALKSRLATKNAPVLPAGLEVAR